MRIINRKGDSEEIVLDKITSRIKKLCYNLDSTVIDPVVISTKVCSMIRDGITTIELDELTANICMNLSLEHPDWGTLGSRIAINNHQKNVRQSFSEAMNNLYNHRDVHDNHSPLVSKEVWEFSQNPENKDWIEKTLKTKRDYLIDYFGFKTLERSYLLKTDGKIQETPQYMWMRVSLGIHGCDKECSKDTYNLMSQKYFTHATPTLFHSGTPRPQMSSCFLMGTDDSVEGIYKTISDTAMISKWAGGIGLHIGNIRCRNSFIRKTGGYSDGILPMLKVYNHTARYINQSGKRNGSFAMYLPDWHGDIFEFLDAKKNHGGEEERARDLFYALWVSDLFMKRVESNGMWSLMCPDRCRNLNDVYGEEFEKLYTEYESKGMYIRQLKAQELWSHILGTQIETGTPYMLYKDPCNKKSNQKNLGTIKSSNLCCEIIEYSDNKEYAVCNLASIALPMYLKHPSLKGSVKIYSKKNCNYCLLTKAFFKERNIDYEEISVDDNHLRQLFFKDILEKEGKEITTVPQIFIDNKRIGGYSELKDHYLPVFDHKKLRSVVHTIVKNLNKIIDINFYPVPETKRSNMRHRPIGIGVQGLADLFAELHYDFEGEKARQLNREVFETIYYASLEMSNELAKEQGPYETFKGSPASEGILQFDMWKGETQFRNNGWDWKGLKESIKKHGIRNSLLVAPMPTASTSQILGCNECFEPFTSNAYTRRTLAGEFTVVNHRLLKKLVNMGIWSDVTKYRLIKERGSVQNMKNLPEEIRKVFKTSWDIKQKTIIEMAADRGRFICQSQSLNIHLKNPTPQLLTKVHFYGWKKGLKTGSYYIRAKSVKNAQNFTIDHSMEQKIKAEEEEEQECLMCGS